VTALPPILPAGSAQAAAGAEGRGAEVPRGWQARRALTLALLRTARPRQWSKNLLVLAAPLAAGAWGRGGRGPVDLMLALAAFVCASAAVYAVNDLADLERDRRHPVKRLRPLASGQLGPGQAWGFAVGCVLTAELLGAWVGSWPFTVVVSGYLVLCLAYTWVLKHVPVLELAVVAAGFVLRALGGACAAGIAPSGWFLLVCSLGALSVVTAKRATEAALLGRSAGGHRPVLLRYRLAWLRAGQRLVLAGTAGAYLAWAAETSMASARVWHLASAVPLVLALARFDRLASARASARVEDLLVNDWMMLTVELLWVLSFLGPVMP
jgi:decaprenyl-phosphate phosphoribosyltransferase